MEANTFITKWEYRYEANLSIDAINELGSQGWELIKVWDCTYLFKRMVLEEWNLDGYKAAAFKPVKQEEPANIEPKPFVTEAGKWYMCIKDRQYWSNIELMFTKGKVYKSPKDGYLTDNHGDCTSPFLEPSFLYQDYFRPATAEEIVKAEAHKAGYDFKMESDNKESEDEKIRKELIDYIKCIRNVTVKGAENSANWIAWLEKKRYSEFELENEYWRGYDDAKKQDEQKPIEYNKEDDRMFQHCVAVVSSNELYKDDEKEPIYDWLKSLHPQKQWKPSKVQIKSLERVLDFYGKGSRIYTSVEKLLKQLKKI